MKLLDLNLLLYAVDHAAPLHQKARPWFEELLSGREAVGFAWNVNLTSDAHLAALALEHGAQLCSTDRDFARFPGLRWINPLD
jgi:predicted nucleic acid-binding protein